MPEPPNPATVTRLLAVWREKRSKEALDRLMPMVYEELRQAAQRAMKRERPGQTLQTTALVHEAYQRLVGQDIAINDRNHFLAIAATLMRRVLVESARARQRAKRGGERVRVPLHEGQLVISSERLDDIVALDGALTRLSELDQRKARAVELHYFGGMTLAEASSVMEISTATLERELRFAKAWLLEELS